VIVREHHTHTQNNTSNDGEKFPTPSEFVSNKLHMGNKNKQTKNSMANKTIKSRLEYQVTELVKNLTEASSASSNQKRDFYTSRAMYNAKRLSEIVDRAKVTA
jgi:hypothetical protein